MPGILGEIRMFSGPYAPEGWAVCDGAELQVAEYPELLSLIGTTYGGDGVKTFKLPDMVFSVTDPETKAPKSVGRIPVHVGAGPGLSATAFGQSGGAEHNRLTVANIPPHNHAFQAATAAANLESPRDALLAKAPPGQLYYTPPTVPKGAPAGTTVTHVDLNAHAVGSAGNGEAFTLGMPSLGIVYMICLQGEYPDFPNQ